MQISHGSIEQGRKYISDQILPRKRINTDYKVIDIGGTVNGWSRSFADLIVDINAQDDDRSIRLDICNEADWHMLETIVELQGQFDYCICTHTLEDVYNPFLALKYMPKIARRGIITMPSINTELSRCENSQWLGFIHHRWLFGHDNNTMIVAPKLNFLESIAEFAVPQIWTEVRYEWKSEIPYRIFMNNYLGPSSNHVVNEYQKFIDNQKFD